DRHALLHQPRHAREPDRELVRDQLADAADPAVAEMVDVIDEAAPLVQLDEVADDRDEILLRQHGVAEREVRAEPLVDLVAADAAQVVALRVEEDALEREAR